MCCAGPDAACIAHPGGDEDAEPGGPRGEQPEGVLVGAVVANVDGQHVGGAVQAQRAQQVRQRASPCPTPPATDG